MRPDHWNVNRIDEETYWCMGKSGNCRKICKGKDSLFRWCAFCEECMDEMKKAFEPKQMKIPKEKK